MTPERLQLQFVHRLGSQTIALEMEATPGITVLFGPSGAGKSVTLRVIAGLVRPDSGRLELNGTTLFDSAGRVDMKPHRRPLAYVPQGYGLFPHMTVAGNIMFAAAHSPDRQQTVQRLLRQLNMAGFEERKPSTLSGGQQQRVALARALARGAPVLLLDEPFSALDENLREELRRELLRLRSELKLTILFVTHDSREAHLLADRLVVLDAGKALQAGDRQEVFRRPASARVAELTGVGNVIPARVTRVEGAFVDVDCAGLAMRAGPLPAPSFSAGDAVDLAIRAERINLRRRSPDELSGTNAMRGHIVEDLGYGAVHRLTIAPEGPGPRLAIELAARPYEVLDVAHQGDWTIEMPAEDIHVMAR